MAGLGIKQRLRQQAIAALITTPSVALAAKQSGVSQRSLARWMDDPQFAAEVQAARNELLSSAMERLKTAAYEAVGTLIEIAANSASSDMARVSASKTLIELALRVGVIERLEERVSELERGGNEPESLTTAGRTIDGNDAKERHNANNDWRTTASDSESSVFTGLQ